MLTYKRLIPPDIQVNYIIIGSVVLFSGYIVSPDGGVWKDGTCLPITKSSNGRLYIRLNINGKRYNIHLAKLIYFLFCSEDMVDFQKNIIQFKDGNCENCSFQNLQLVPLTTNLKHRRKKNKILSAEDVTQIKASYHLPSGVINQHNKQHLSIRDLAKKYHCSKYVIQKIIHDKY